MKTLPPFQTVTMGFVVAVVGFFSSFPIVLQGLAGIGANDIQAASGLMAAAIAMGLAGIALSPWQRQPISVAWSTPGVALLAVLAVPEGGFAAAIGAFLLAGALTLVAGLFRPFGKLATAIPAPLAQTMLAILSANGYSPPPGPLLSGVGAASVQSAPFGAPATCLAAITAAMYCSDDAVIFLVTASGVMIFGLSAVVWGLVLGGLALLVAARRTRA